MRLMLAASLALLAALPSSAQEGFRDRTGGRVRWYPTIESVGGNANMDEFERRRLRAFGMEPGEKKFIFVYVRPITEDKEPNEFMNQDVVTASREKWAFVKMDFDKENAQLKAWGVGRAPAIVGCDLHANDFQKAASVGLDAIRSLLKGVPPAVLAYETKLKVDYSKALEALRSDEEKGTALLVNLVANGKHGYKEVGEAQKRLDEISQTALQKGELAEAVSLEAGIDYNEDLSKSFKTSSAGVMAEIRIARLEHERGNAAVAIARLLKVQKYDARTLKKEIEEAGKALEEISKAGEAKIDAALALDRAAAREVLRKLAKDYTGTEAGKKATEAAKRME
jgi:hypothetical protein